MFEDIYNIEDPERNFNNVGRRIIKLSEELGELSEAYLSYTNPNSYKNKQYEDIIEEAVDCAIVSLDILVTLIKEDKQLAYTVFEKKLNKWRKQLETDSN